MTEEYKQIKALVYNGAENKNQLLKKEIKTNRNLLLTIGSILIVGIIYIIAYIHK